MKIRNVLMLFVLSIFSIHQNALGIRTVVNNSAYPITVDATQCGTCQLSTNVPKGQAVVLGLPHPATTYLSLPDRSILPSQPPRQVACDPTDSTNYQKYCE